MSVDSAPRTPDQLQHAVAFHDSLPDLLRQVVPLVRDGLDRGDTVVLAVAEQTREGLREALGDLDGVIVFDHPDGPQRICGQSMAVHRARALEELVARGPVTAIGEHDSHLDGPDGRFWTELEAASHVAMSHLPIRMTCFFPLLPLHQVVLDGARRVHPLIWADGHLHPNPEHRPPHEVMTEIPAPAPVLLGVPHHELEFGSEGLREVRTLVERVLRDRVSCPEQVGDVVLALNEVATNAVEHGRGPARLTLWAEPGSCVAEVHDQGVLDDPLPGLTAPDPGQDHGWGLWVARQACDYLRIWTDDAGTHVRIHVTV